MTSRLMRSMHNDITRVAQAATEPEMFELLDDLRGVRDLQI